MIFARGHDDCGEFDVEEVIQNASVAEKVSLLAGLDFWHTTPLPRFNVPSIRFSDGPNGVRGTKFFDGVRAACLPCGTGLAATWNQQLLYQAGVLIGEECKAKGVHSWLGPTVCVQRSPLCGRGFESMSEDPYVTGKMAASYINGVQSTGVISVIKHWFANDQEHERVGVNVVVSDRAMREIHMLPFQIALGESNPGAVMASYSKVNGAHVSENKELLQGILREDWDWDGLTVSDWFGTYSTAESLNAGLDLEMPGPTRLRGTLADLAVSTRKVTRQVIDDRARSLLKFVKKASKVQVSGFEGIRNLPEDQNLNRKLAAESVVLLRNNSGLLPLQRDIKKIALIGPNMDIAAFCGGGSASLQPYYTVSPLKGITDKLTPGAEIIFRTGATAYGYLPLLLSNNVTTPEGLPGMRMRFYKNSCASATRDVVHEIVISESNWQLMGFSHPLLDRLFYADVLGDFVAPNTGQYEVGVAVYGSLKFYVDDMLVIDNATKQSGGNYYFGKGTREEKAILSFTKGQSYRFRLEYGSAPTSTLVKPGVVNFGGGSGRFGIVEKIDEEFAIHEAVQAAKEAEVAIICAGLTSDWESEGFDRKHMHIPQAVNKLIKAVLEARPETIIVTQSGTPIDMTAWIDSVETHVHAWYGGNEVGNGIADVLFGDVNPSGKLPLSFPRRIEDTPAFLNFGSERGRVLYGEDIYVGYRYYEKVKRDVLYPFGYGLSYTTFAYSDLEVTQNSVAFDITNTGSYDGAESAQLYIAASDETSTIGRPKKELKGFTKVTLQRTDSCRVRIEFDKFTFAYWDEVLQCWVCEKGVYTVMIGSSSRDIKLQGELHITETKTWSGL